MAMKFAIEVDKQEADALLGFFKKLTDSLAGVSKIDIGSNLSKQIGMISDSMSKLSSAGGKDSFVNIFKDMEKAHKDAFGPVIQNLINEETKNLGNLQQKIKDTSEAMAKLKRESADTTTASFKQTSADLALDYQKYNKQKNETEAKLAQMTQGGTGNLPPPSANVPVDSSSGFFGRDFSNMRFGAMRTLGNIGAVGAAASGIMSLPTEIHDAAYLAGQRSVLSEAQVVGAAGRDAMAGRMGRLSNRLTDTGEGAQEFNSVTGLGAVSAAAQSLGSVYSGALGGVGRFFGIQNDMRYMTPTEAYNKRIMKLEEGESSLKYKDEAISGIIGRAKQSMGYQETFGYDATQDAYNLALGRGVGQKEAGSTVNALAAVGIKATSANMLNPYLNMRYGISENLTQQQYYREGLRGGTGDLYGRNLRLLDAAGLGGVTGTARTAFTDMAAGILNQRGGANDLDFSLAAQFKGAYESMTAGGATPGAAGMAAAQGVRNAQASMSGGGYLNQSLNLKLRELGITNDNERMAIINWGIDSPQSIKFIARRVFGGDEAKAENALKGVAGNYNALMGGITQFSSQGNQIMRELDPTLAGVADENVGRAAVNSAVGTAGSFVLTGAGIGAKIDPSKSTTGVVRTPDTTRTAENQQQAKIDSTYMDFISKTDGAAASIGRLGAAADSIAVEFNGILTDLKKRSKDEADIRYQRELYSAPLFGTVAPVAPKGQQNQNANKKEKET